MSSELVTINLVVWNGEKYLRHCLNSILNQSYDHSSIKINIWDNNSSDSTKQIIEEYLPKFVSSSYRLPITNYSETNIGMWPAQEKLLEQSEGEIIVVISVDILLDPKFIEESLRVMEAYPKIGALQAKIFQYDIRKLKVDISEWSENKIQKPHSTFHIPHSRVIDTCGFKIFRSRELNNIGHGVKSNSIQDDFDFDKEQEIFAVEGAVPVFRKVALEDCRIQGHFIDPDFFWYGDDIDLTWRMRLFGWKQIFAPTVVAYHDRHTTKSIGRSKIGFISARKQLPMFKRRLDWRNWTLTVIKNDYTRNFFRDLPYILVRQFQMWGYFLLFEPSMYLEPFKVARLLPRMLKRRRAIMQKARVSPYEIHKWFY